jgi:hypothetical protein
MVLRAHAARAGPSQPDPDRPISAARLTAGRSRARILDCWGVFVRPDGFFTEIAWRDDRIFGGFDVTAWEFSIPGRFLQERDGFGVGGAGSQTTAVFDLAAGGSCGIIPGHRTAAGRQA